MIATVMIACCRRAAIKKALHGKVEPLLCHALGSDPDMPRAVKRAIGASVRELVTEIEITLADTVEVAIQGTDASIKELIEADPRPCCRPNPCAWARANILYTLFPHDQSVWEQMRSPAWWFLKILSVFPYYFVAMSVWFVLWLLRSKRDQYQLVSFIVSLKQAHFIAYGMMGSLMGNFSFIQCAMLSPSEAPCATHAPGLHLPFWPTAVQFALQVLLTWINVALIPCSEQRGNRRGIANDDGAVAVDRGRDDGDKFGRLKFWIMYDTVCNLALVGIMVWAVIGTGAVDAGPADIPEMMQFTVWWSRILYGWLCLPWMFLQGFLYPLVLHTKATAYNTRGQCVPIATGKERNKAWKKRHGSRNRVAQDPVVVTEGPTISV